MKRLLTVLIRFLPVIILFGLLIYLKSINSVSEVYIDLVSTKTSFDIAEQTDELMSSISVDSLQLRNCDLKLKLGKIFDALGRPVMPARNEFRVTRNDTTVDSEIHLSKLGRMLLRNLRVPRLSKIDIIREHNAMRIEFTRDSTATDNFRGEIDVGRSFRFASRNVKLSGGQQYSDYALLSISPHPILKKLMFEANGAGMTVILYLSPGEAIFSEIIKNLFVKNVSFVEIDDSKRKSNEESTILSGDVQIAGIDFFNKRFLLKEEKLAQSDFLDIADDDEYFISSLSLTENALQLSMFCEQATELEKGKRIRLLRSIFPSLLDFVIAEPTKKTFWTILVFVLAQISLFQKVLKEHWQTVNQKSRAFKVDEKGESNQSR